MRQDELLIKVIDILEKVDMKIENNNTQLIKHISEKTDKIESQISNFVTKEDCNIKAKENISIRKFTALSLMFGTIGGSLIGLIDKLKKLIEVILKG
jgi:hypothetical protein